MERLTIQTEKGAVLKLNSPKTEQEAREQLMAAYKVAINKLAAYEDTGLTPEEVERVNTFAGSELKRMLVKNAKLEHDLECAKRGLKADWISVDNERPEKQQRVVARLSTGEVVVGWILWDKWMTDFGVSSDAEVTHWMPLPESREED